MPRAQGASKKETFEMGPFKYFKGKLFAEGVSIANLAEEIGTPFYCYSSAMLEKQYHMFASAVQSLDMEICYAVKANSNIAVIRTLARLGAGADVVSVGEFKRAIVAGIPANKIIYSGVGKTPTELRLVLNGGIKQINVESEAELDAISEISRSIGVEANIAIRVNPNVDAETHEKITTGRSENKFGIDIASASSIFQRAASLPNLNVTGVAVHIGSQLVSLIPYRKAYKRLYGLVKTLREEGINIVNLDLGGGLGIKYNNEIIPSSKSYGQMVSEVLGTLGCHITFEPGRIISGDSGIMVTRVVLMKDGADRIFCVVDGAMNDLVRPTLYNAYHEIIKIEEPDNNGETFLVDVVGPICESGDFFAQRREMPSLKKGDLLAICSAGAYGAVMSSTYNSRPLIPEIMVKGEDFSIIRKRLEVDDMIDFEKFPSWLD